MHADRQVLSAMTCRIPISAGRQKLTAHVPQPVLGIPFPESLCRAGTAQGSPCVHKQARLLRWIARLFLPDLYEVIQFYRTSSAETNVAELEEEYERRALGVLSENALEGASRSDRISCHESDRSLPSSRQGDRWAAVCIQATQAPLHPLDK